MTDVLVAVIEAAGTIVAAWLTGWLTSRRRRNDTPPPNQNIEPADNEDDTNIPRS